MEKKFIYQSDLGEMLEDIAKKAMEHSEKMSTHVTFRRNEMAVSVIRNDGDYRCLSNKVYEIVDEVQNSLDLLDDIFGDALEALEQLTVIKKEESTTNTK